MILPVTKGFQQYSWEHTTEVIIYILFLRSSDISSKYPGKDELLHIVKSLPGTMAYTVIFWKVPLLPHQKLGLCFFTSTMRWCMLISSDRTGRFLKGAWDSTLWKR